MKVNENGYITVTQEHCSDYVITLENPEDLYAKYQETQNPSDGKNSGNDNNVLNPSDSNNSQNNKNQNNNHQKQKIIHQSFYSP